MPEELKTVYVGNLTAAADEKALRSVFETCGEVRQVRLAGKPGHETIYSFVEFAEPSNAHMALAMDGLQVGDRPIRVKIAKSNPLPPGQRPPHHGPPPAGRQYGGDAHRGDPYREAPPRDSYRPVQLPPPREQYRQPLPAAQQPPYDRPYEPAAAAPPYGQSARHPPARGPPHQYAPPPQQPPPYEEPYQQQPPYQEPPYQQPPPQQPPPQQEYRPTQQYSAPRQQYAAPRPQAQPPPRYDSGHSRAPRRTTHHHEPSLPTSAYTSVPPRHQQPPTTRERAYDPPPPRERPEPARGPPRGSSYPSSSHRGPPHDRAHASGGAASRRESTDNPHTVARTVYIEGIEAGFDEESIALFFSNLGTVTAVRIAGHPSMSDRRGWAEFETTEQAVMALQYDGQVLGATNIRVQTSRSAIRNNGLRRPLRSRSRSPVPNGGSNHHRRHSSEADGGHRQRSPSPQPEEERRRERPGDRAMDFAESAAASNAVSEDHERPTGAQWTPESTEVGGTNLDTEETADTDHVEHLSRKRQIDDGAADAVDMADNKRMRAESLSDARG